MPSVAANTDPLARLVAFRLSPAQLAELRAEAARRSLPVSGLIRESLNATGSLGGFGGGGYGGAQGQSVIGRQAERQA